MCDFISPHLCNVNYREEFEVCGNRHVVTNSQEVSEVVEVVEGATKLWSRNLWI